MTTPAIPILVERWRRYGHDRAYVKIDGRQLGHRDLRTGAVHCTEPADRDIIEQATQHLLAPPAIDPPEPAATPAVDQEHGDYAARHAAAEPGQVPQPSLRPVSRPSLRPDQDLSTNRAGQAAREQAVAERQAAPVRTLIALIAGAKTDERAWRIGADAEREVGRRLTALGPDWRCLHALPIGDRGSDIDHVVIGPAGVFTLNTKHHPGANVWVRGDTFKVKGQNQHYVRNSRSEARRAARLLSVRAGIEVRVRALIVMVGATGGVTVKEQPVDGEVFVVDGKRVVKHLRSLPPSLDEAGVERIYQCARHLATWQPKTVGWSDF